ncbi:MAG: cytochrome c oxidase subunit II [Omnitrophica WOR_2 bacterium RIFCSPHIGHO2_02_FULL_68_15]|nr:MAG: cytochrome c oxidase subunit II [Omnitrophica WOR_2 bacterium RIFCSPHIGHO2_02_FULL_68_15]
MLLPPVASSIGPAIDRLFYLILAVTGFFFILVEGALVWFVIHYRQRPGRTAAYVHGNTVAEIIWTAIPAVILIWLTFASQRVWATIHGHIPANAAEVEILAEQFAWNIRYPGPDGRFETADDVTTINQLHLALNHPTVIWLKSKDVIHSFFVPAFRIKQDAVPGRGGQIWVKPTRPGQYEIACAELCGLGHYRMRGFITVEPWDQLQQWLKETKANE